MNVELPPREFLTDFLLEKIAAEPESRRVLLYRALAADTDDEALRADCRRRAAAIEANLKDERQMVLNFRLRHQPRPDEGNGSA